MELCVLVDNTNTEVGMEYGVTATKVKDTSDHKIKGSF